MKENTCCFFGHRTITETKELKKHLSDTIENLIQNKNISTFLFGSKSQFDSLYLKLVTNLKEKYPHIRRIYVRAEFPDIHKEYEDYLQNFYDDSYFPEKLVGAGKAVYVERNREIIDQSRYCIVYYNIENTPTTRKSGTKIALSYARKKEREILIFPLCSKHG